MDQITTRFIFGIGVGVGVLISALARYTAQVCHKKRKIKEV